ncbi:MAG: YbhN family protein [Candidatus Hodarchaeota archaeon]
MNEDNTNKILNWLKKRKRLLIGITTIILIIFMVYVVDFPSLIQKIITVGIIGLILFILTYACAFLLRAYKMKLIFKGLDHKVKYTNCLFSTGASFIINDLTPGKLGDVAKIFIIRDHESIGLGESTAGIAVERILDLILLFFISCFALIYLYLSNIGDVSSREFLGLNMQYYLLFGAIIIIGILLAIFLLLYKTDPILKIITKISPTIANYLGRFVINFKRGIKKLKENKRKLIYVILLGFPVWIVDGFVIVIIFYALGFQLDIIVLILAILLTFFSKIIPFTPGGWVISEPFGALFTYFFYPLFPGGFYEILSLFIIDHIFRSAFLLFFGGYSVFRYNFKLKELEQINT